MNKKDKSPFKSGGICYYTFFLTVLLCAVVLYGISCNLPPGPNFGKGTLTLLLPETRGRKTGASVQNEAAVSRSVLSDGFTGTLVYRLTLTGPGETQTLEAGGGGTTLILDAGGWTIAAVAYDPGDPTTPVGSGTAEFTVIAGRSSYVKIPMTVSAAYEAGLTAIYIHNETELRRIGTDFLIDGTIGFFLERDIVLSQPWTPIGNSGTPFEAVFDGGGHTISISSFSPAALSGAYLGLFGCTDGADIQNLTVVYNLTASSSYSGIQWLGGLAASATGTLISGVHVKGTIQHTASNSLNIGGLVGGAGGNSGSSTDTRIYGSSFAGVLNGNGTMGVSAGGILGGLNGSTDNAIIETSYAAGIISATSTSAYVYAGGIAGDGACNIGNCYSIAEVAASASSDAYAGGIIGQLSINVTGFGKCYALGPVSAAGTTINAGGIAGRSGSPFQNCAALAEVDGGSSSTVGRVIGNLWTGVYSATNYAAYDKPITRVALGATAEDGETAYNVSNLQGPGNHLKYATDLSWNFTTDWKWLSGYDYPVLEWQTTPPNLPYLPPPPV